SQDLGANVVVGAGKVEARGFDALRRGDERLGGEQVRQVRERGPFGGGKDEALAIVERTPRRRVEARIPHEGRVEGGVDDHGRPALVARPGAPWTDDAVVVDADRDGLRVAEAIARRVTPTARVVVVQPLDAVEPEEATDVGELMVDAA